MDAPDEADTVPEEQVPADEPAVEDGDGDSAGEAVSADPATGDGDTASPDGAAPETRPEDLSSSAEDPPGTDPELEGGEVAHHDEVADVDGVDSESSVDTDPESDSDSESDADGGEEPSSVMDEPIEDLEQRAEDEGVSMMELLLREGEYLPEQPHRGDLIEAVVVSKDKNQLTVNIGAKQEGLVPASDIARLPPGQFDSIQVGDHVQAIVMRPEGRDGEVILSLYQALSLEDWERAKQLMESGEIVELEIVGYNSGGVLVDYGHLQGFMPRSHLARMSGGDGGPERMAEFIGQKVPVKIIEVSRRKRRLIMSERQAIREWRTRQKKQLLSELKEGEVRRGRVTSIADFGAFVDLGGADGLVHVSEMTFERGKQPRDIVKVGQEVDVYVLSIDPDRRRIGLSMKRLQKDPWATVEEDHYVGELTEAVIANVTDFGAFAKLQDGLEGLIHVSELSDQHVGHASEAVRPGQSVTVEVISIDPERHRIGLSLRRVPEHLRGTQEEVVDGSSGNGEVTDDAGPDGGAEGDGESSGGDEGGAGAGSDALDDSADGPDVEGTSPRIEMDESGDSDTDGGTVESSDERPARDAGHETEPPDEGVGPAAGEGTA